MRINSIRKEGKDVADTRKISNQRHYRAIRAGKKRREKRIRYFDYSLLASVILLIAFGLVMLYSASYYDAYLSKNHDYMWYFRKQALISVGAVMIAILISHLNYHVYAFFASFIYVVSLGLMALVRFSPLGVTHNGARRWLKIGIEFQPSEIAKIAVILFLPVLIIKMGRSIKTLRGVCVLLFFGALQAAAAKIFTDNLSTALIIMLIACVIIFIAHPKTLPFVLLGAFVAAAAAVFVFMVKHGVIGSGSFRLDRVRVWLNPEKYSADGGFQVLQGLYAIGSGGFFGKGLGNSEQKLSSIPESQNDMIFTIICEELGVFGAVLVLLMFAYLLYRLYFIAQNSRDLYGTLVVSGIFAHIFIQVMLNICVVVNLIPTTGITLPFISYGGTSGLFLMTEIGIALSVARQIDYEIPKKPAGRKRQGEAG